jgi:hypothetical protein
MEGAHSRSNPQSLSDGTCSHVCAELEPSVPGEPGRQIYIGRRLSVPRTTVTAIWDACLRASRKPRTPPVRTCCQVQLKLRISKGPKKANQDKARPASPPARALPFPSHVCRVPRLRASAPAVRPASGMGAHPLDNGTAAPPATRARQPRWHEGGRVGSARHLPREHRLLRKEVPPPHPHWGWAHPCHMHTVTGLAPATCTAGLGSPLPHVHRDWARPCHMHIGTGLAPATSTP